MRTNKLEKEKFMYSNINFSISGLGKGRADEQCVRGGERQERHCAAGSDPAVHTVDLGVHTALEHGESQFGPRAERHSDRAASALGHDRVE